MVAEQIEAITEIWWSGPSTARESALSTQMNCILVMTTAGAPLDKCHNAGVNEGLEAWRQFVKEWEPKLRTTYVGFRRFETTF